jgi:hypothetical protein
MVRKFRREDVSLFFSVYIKVKFKEVKTITLQVFV